MTETKQIAVIDKQVSPVISQISALEIAGPKDMEVASDIRTKLKKIASSVKADKEKITKPLNETLKEVRGRYSPIEDKIDEALTMLDKKMSIYQTEAKRIADAEAAKIAARVGDGKGKLQPETAVRKLGEIDAPAQVIDSEHGSTGFITVKKFEVINLNKLPIEYHLANETMIRQAMREGVELAGVRYWEEQAPRNSR